MELMKLKVLMPTRVLVDREVSVLRVEAVDGECTLLPGHIDFMAPLAPGILSFEDDEGETFIATDEGILVKRGKEVTVSVMRGTRGGELGTLQATLEEEFLKEGSEEQQAKTAVKKLEAQFSRLFYEVEQIE